MRVPTTFNQKHTPPQLVTIYNCTIDNPTHRPYSFNELERIIKSYKIQLRRSKTLGVEDGKQRIQVVIVDANTYPCVQKMISNGVEKGYRNLALGKITSCLKCWGYTKEKALEIVHDWNRRCNPSKDEHEVVADFQRYWVTDYKLLGCNPEDGRARELLETFCDRDTCNFKAYNHHGDWTPLHLRRCEVKDATFRKLSGIDLFIIATLHQFDDYASTNEINGKLTSSETDKPCLCNNTLKKSLHRLNGNLVESDHSGRRWRIKRPTLLPC